MRRLSQVERPPRCPENDKQAAEVWRAATKLTLDELLGPWPIPVAPEFEVLSESLVDDGAGVTRREVVFDSEVDMSVPASILMPDGAPAVAAGAPAILAIHGHGPGRSEAVDWGIEWARAGFVVLAPDLRGFGEREELSWDDKYWCDLNAVSGQMFGVSPLTQNLWDLRGCLDVLASLPEVDATCIGAAGFSYGGTCTLFLAAVDDRVRAAVVSGYLASWAEAHKMPANMCGSQVLPGLFGRLEHGDLGALVSPRALFVESCREDYLFPWQTAAEEVEHLRRLGGVVEHHIHDGDHQWVGEGVLEFFQHRLG